MAAPTSPGTDIALLSLRGGMNDTDTESALKDDECVLAENVEFFFSNIGERRGGTTSLDLTGSGLTSEACIGHLSQWFPDNDPTTAEFWGIGITPTVSTTWARRTGGTWFNVIPLDAPTLLSPDVYAIQSVPLNGKFFFAYHSVQDRMHVWDGTSLRRAGIAEPAAPTLADEGSGSYATKRYFRIRYIIKSGSTVLARSEPSVSANLTPSGSGAGITVTRPALLGESETHWEIEGSLDNANFYLVTTLPVSTTTYNDTTASVYSGGTLSEVIGTYLLLPSAKFIDVDGDRLIFGSHWTDLSQQSQIGWTPVFADPGAGNDERLPLQINNTRNLDNYTGGPLTGLASAVYGTWYAFKWERIYQMTRTSDVTNAYDPITISTTRGAIPGSIFKGVDENGGPCVYFLDPHYGASRIGQYGIQTIKGLFTNWARVNLKATDIIARGCYYPDKQQAMWVYAADGSNTPSFGIKAQVSEFRVSEGGSVGRGLSTFTGLPARALTMCVFTEWVTIAGVNSISYRPFIGLASPDFVQRTDTGTTDNGTAFTATITSRPYIAAGLLNRWGVMVGALLAQAKTGQQIKIRLIKNMGVEISATKTVSLTPAGTESQIVATVDDLAISDARLIQVQFSDA